MNDGKGSYMGSMIKLRSHELFTVDLIGNGVFGENRNACIDFEGSFDRFDIVEFHHDGDVDPRITEKLVGCPAGWNILFEGDELLTLQVGNGEIVFLGKWVIGVISLIQIAK